MVKGVRQLERKLLRKIPEAVREEVRQALEKSANEIVATMKRYVPVDQGALRDSIGWVWGSEPPKGTFSVGTLRGPDQANDLVITIFAGGEGAFHAHLIELGTVKMAAQPFFYPSYRLNRRRTRGRLTRAIKKGVRAGAK